MRAAAVASVVVAMPRSLSTGRHLMHGLQHRPPPLPPLQPRVPATPNRPGDRQRRHPRNRGVHPTPGRRLRHTGFSASAVPTHLPFCTGLVVWRSRSMRQSPLGNSCTHRSLLIDGFLRESPPPNPQKPLPPLLSSPPPLSSSSLLFLSPLSSSSLVCFALLFPVPSSLIHCTCPQIAAEATFPVRHRCKGGWGRRGPQKVWLWLLAGWQGERTDDHRGCDLM